MENSLRTKARHGSLEQAHRGGEAAVEMEECCGQKDPRLMLCLQRIHKSMDLPVLEYRSRRSVGYNAFAMLVAQKPIGDPVPRKLNSAGPGRVKINASAMQQTADDTLDASIVVFDGIRPVKVEKWRGMMNDLARKGTAVVVASSEGVRLHDGDSSDIIKLQHIMPSWTLNEHYGACSNGGFWEAFHLKYQNGITPDDDEGVDKNC